MGAAQGSQASINRQLYDKVNELSGLITKPNPTDDEKQHIAELKSQITQIREAVNPTKIPASGGPWYSIQGEDKKWYEFKKDPSTGEEIPDTRRPISVAAGNKPVRSWKIGAKGKPVGIMLDPSTNQEVPGSENPELIPPSSMLQHISNGFYVYTDDNGEVHKVPVQRETSPVLPSASLPPEHTDNPDHPNHPDHKGVTPKTVDTASTHSDVIGHKGPPRAKIDQLDKETNAAYQKAVDDFNKSVDALSDPNLHLTPDQIAGAKNKFYDRLQEENGEIGKTHSQRMRDLGLIPAEDSGKQANDPLNILK
jgi:hypothetical protein